MKATIRKAEFGKVKGFASVEVAQGITIDGFKIVEGKDGLWVSPPSRKSEKNGKITYWDTVHIASTEIKDQISQAVLSAFKA